MFIYNEVSHIPFFTYVTDIAVFYGHVDSYMEVFINWRHFRKLSNTLKVLFVGLQAGGFLDGHSDVL
jgi:hypothetical protein